MLVLLLFSAALGVAAARQRFIETIQASTPTVKRWGGFVLIAVGGWFILLGVFARAFAPLFPV